MNFTKTLIIRLSSFGDIIQALESARCIKNNNPQSEVHWVVRNDSYELVKSCPYIDKVHVVRRDQNAWQLVKLSIKLRKESFALIYDAHNNLRSRIISLFTSFLSATRVIRRSKDRYKRYLLFKKRINRFPNPFKGSHSFLEPLHFSTNILKKTKKEDLLITRSLVNHPSEKLQKLLNSDKPIVCMAPSAAWEMKRWPEGHWVTLCNSLKEKYSIALLGGPADHQIKNIHDACTNTHNLAGELSWVETSELIKQSICTISGDTGVLHLADYLQKLNIGLMGPTAFGFTSRETSHILEVEMPCRPCTKDGRGGCSQDIYKKCLIDISPQMVVDKLNKLMKTDSRA